MCDLTSPTYTLSAWLGRWLDVYAPLRCTQKTVERYRQLANYVRAGATPELAAAAGANIAELSHKVLEPAILSLLAAPALRRAHLSNRTIRHIASVVTAALDKAAMLDLLASNPMLKVDLPAFRPKSIRALDPREIKALRDVCRSDWTFPLVELALATGCRRGELLALEWNDVNWPAGTLSISKSIEETRAGIRLKTTKSGRPRCCRLPDAALDALRAHRQEHQADSLVFAAPGGAYRRPSLVSQIVIRRLRKAGLPDASLHTLRHYATSRTMLPRRTESGFGPWQAGFCNAGWSLSWGIVREVLVIAS